MYRIKDLLLSFPLFLFFFESLQIYINEVFLFLEHVPDSHKDLAGYGNLYTQHLASAFLCDSQCNIEGLA